MRRRQLAISLLSLVWLHALAAHGDVVINEIMYNPASGDPNATYVELHNTSPDPVPLSGWRFTRGFTFTFPDTSLPGGGYLVVCRNAAHIRRLYGITNTAGDFQGDLARGGETLEIVDARGNAIDLVEYGDREPWPVRPDGNGGALGLINPALDNDAGDHWAAETVANTGWRRIVARGVFDPVSNIKFYLELDGEALIDDVELVRESQPGVNLLGNPGFESGTTGWFLLGNHINSAIESGDTHSGNYALHVRAGGKGDFASNNIEHAVSFSATNREFFTLSLWAKPLDETNAIALGSGDGRQSTLYSVFHISQSVPDFFAGSPGRQNYVYKPLPQPFFTRHDRSPDSPAAGQPALLTLTVENPDKVADMTLHYTVQNLPLGAPAPDPEALVFNTLGLTRVGATWTGILPGQPAGTLVRYYVEMTSANGGTVFRRPRRNDLRRYYGYCVKSAALPDHKVPVFYLQINPRRKALVDDIGDDLFYGVFKNYNLSVRADFVDLKTGEYFGDVRTRWRGGVLRRLWKNNVKIRFNDGHRWDGLRVLNMTPNNQGRAAATLGLANALSHQLERRFGLPSLDMAQWARVYYNGEDRGLLTMVEQPDRNFLERFGLSRSGQMFKSIGWRHDYPRINGDESLFYGPVNDAQDHLPRLRDSIDNPYTLDEFSHYAYDRELDSERGFNDLISFIQTINNIPNDYPMPTADPDFIWLSDCVGSQEMLVQMRDYLESACDVDLMLRKFVVDAIGGETDRVIHNHYWYKGDDGKWFLLSWDRDFWAGVFGHGSAIFIQVGRWYKATSPYPRVFRMPFTIPTAPWPTLTVMMWPPEFRRRYYGLIREVYEENVTPFTMQNYIDKQLDYVLPEHALANSTPTLDLNEFQAQQDWLNAQRVRIFQYMQSSVVDVDPALLHPLVCDVRHTPPVSAPSQPIEFQAHAVSSVGTGLCDAVTLMLRGPADAGFVARAMTRIADDPGYTGAVPDPAYTYFFIAPGLAPGQIYEYYIVAADTGPGGGARTTTMPRGGPAAPRRVMADDNPALSARGVLVNEIMYHGDIEANEYVELTNRSSRIVDLSGWSLIDTSTKRPFVFENDVTLAPGEYLVVAGNAWRIRKVYGIENVVGDFAFRLGNAGDALFLRDGSGTSIDEVAYSDDPPWPAVADGLGPALELMNGALDNNTPGAYGRSFPIGHRGTPGRPNYLTRSSAVHWREY